MSILKSTRRGYKYYYGKEALQRCCKFYLDGQEVDFTAEINDDETVNVSPAEEQVQMAMYSKTMQRGPGMPSEWFEDMPIKMFHFIGPSKNYELVIKQPFDKELHFGKLTVNVRIECELPNITEIFNKTQIYGFVTVADNLQEIYNQEFLCTNRICSYYGKSYMGF